MAKIEAAYNYLMTTYGKTTGSRYDSHKKSELHSVYNNIVKINKESPLYKITQSGDIKEYAIDVKANAHRMQNIIAALSSSGDDISSLMNKRVAMSSDEDAVSVEYIGSDDEKNVKGFDIEVKKLATPQVNEGNYLKRNGHSFEEGSFSFDLDTASNSYEFQFNVNAGDNNYDVQSKIMRLVNQSDIGLFAEVVMNDSGESALKITSKQTGRDEGEDRLFHIQSGSSWNEVNTLGIGKITSPAENSQFILNGKEHSSLSNTFTINKAFEITLHKPTAQESPAHIGFKANTDAIGDGVTEMLQAYNGMIAVGIKYSSAHANHRLLNEVASIGRSLSEDLSAVGITADDEGFLSLDRDVLSSAINGENAQANFKTLNTFKNALTRQSQKAALNPMQYVDKVIVEYKNPGKNFAAPYASSTFSGMLVDKFL